MASNNKSGGWGWRADGAKGSEGLSEKLKNALKKAQKMAAEKAAADKAAADKAAAEKVAAEKAAAEKAAAEKAAAEKAAAEKVASEKAAAEKVAAEKAAAEKAAAENTGDDHNDTLVGNGSVNKLAGDEHDNKVFGEGGSDVLTGGAGDDQMHGGGGDDQMSGDAGNDTMFGASTLGGKLDLSKFKVSEDTTATVTFDNETAGYKNALGVYKIGADGSISGAQILFANASLKGSGGDLEAGVSALKLDLKAGESLGFFVVPDGYSQRGMAKLLSDTGATFKFVDSDGGAGNIYSGEPLKLVQVAENGKETVIQSAYGTTIFHSVDDGSLGLNGDGLDHAVGTVNNADGTVTIGFEDLLNGGDKDFDDSVFTVSLGVVNTALLAKEKTKPVASSDKDLMIGGDGADKMFGMADDDTMHGAAGDDQMWGNSGNDVMHGDDGNDVMSGGKGDDVLSDGLGDDVVEGNSGDDVFVAGEGNDDYVGGSGFDTIDYSGAKNAVSVDLNSHTATGLGNDTMSGVEAVIGTSYDDTLVGDKADNVFYGGDGNDSFRGRGGADTFTGGAGNDTYVWLKKDVGTGVDRITDFSAGDSLNLKDLLKGQTYSDINDVVKVLAGAGGSTVSVNIDGTYVDVVTLDGVQGTSASDMLKVGMILV